ncbi:hypothetical protein N658DRAFT_569096 [Parathielavia hyrcaniae]|uniref:Uncharacterized protein n=1 Tax=Parathielavia hyrcaniae TaxID=113614 RepID=A0AAN6PU54_9PEZI|nr:hypothetical protein N658DRAFT_569096 [Parathielavia hyrcaniae]
MSSSNNPQNPQGSTQNPQAQNQQPGLWTSHAEYIKGAAESTVGNLTGSQAWRASGEQDKAHARAAMQAVAEHRDPAKSGYGRAEEIAGSLTGCEGMKHEGAASKGAGPGKPHDE